MKKSPTVFVLTSLLCGQLVFAQDNTPADDWKPAPTNQNGKEYPMVNSEGRVKFRIVAPEATSVGCTFRDSSEFTKGEDGAWYGYTRPLDEGFHYYELIIDGANVPDPNSKYYYGSSRWGSGVEVPAHDREFYTLKNVPHGDLREVYYHSKHADAMLRCFVYTPPGYDQNPDKRYPVLYLQHGGGEDETGWGSQGHTGFIMDNLIAEGKSKPFIIVMANSYIPGAPRPARGGASLDDGDPAYSKSIRAFGDRTFHFTPFAKVLIDDLIPHIESKYRTLTDQPNRAMAGLSMGGMQTRSITLANLDKFSHIGIFSGGSIAPDDIDDMAEFKEQVELVFVSYGSKENGATAKEHVATLKEAGIDSVYYESPETAHEWLTWRRSLREFAPLLFNN